MKHSRSWRYTKLIQIVGKLIRRVIKKLSGKKITNLYKVMTNQEKEFSKLEKGKKGKGKKVQQQARRCIENIEKRLYGLGFTELPLSELKFFYEDKSKPVMRRYAAFELARWYANQYDKEGAQLSLKILKVAKEGETDATRLRQIAILEIEYREILGDKDASLKVVDNAIKSLGTDPNLLLAAANLETTLAGRIKWINRSLESYGISHISYDPYFLEPSMDSLRPGEIIRKKELIDTNKPLVSVIVPTYNAEKTIGYALDSILNQIWLNLEIIVVDDCSNDNTVHVVEGYVTKDSRVQLIKAEENMGPYVARNLVLKKVTGEFVTTHDADDWSHPEKIDIQVSHLMGNPSVIGNTSQMARTYPDLKFYRGNSPGILISRFPCSFMFRRKPVIETIGFWDCVRFAADTEYIRRTKKAFGKDTVVHLHTGPLTFYRQSFDSLSGNQVFGHPGYYMGARKEYFEAQTYYHNNARNLYYSFPQKTRLFPVPEPMWIEREELSRSGRRHFDIIIISDFRKMGVSGNNNLEEIRTQKMLGNRIGLIQMYDYNLNPNKVVTPQVREVIDGDLVQMIVYGEKVSCGLLIIPDLRVLQEKQRYIPDVQAHNVRLGEP